MQGALRAFLAIRDSGESDVERSTAPIWKRDHELNHVIHFVDSAPRLRLGRISAFAPLTGVHKFVHSVQP